MSQYSRKLLPFKILVLLVWGKHSSVRWNGNRCTMYYRRFCKSTRITHDRMYEYLKALRHWGYLSKLTTDWNTANFTLVMPPQRVLLMDDYTGEIGELESEVPFEVT